MSELALYKTWKVWSVLCSLIYTFSPSHVVFHHPDRHYLELWHRHGDSEHDQADAQVDKNHPSDMTSANDTHMLTISNTNIPTTTNTKGCRQWCQVNRLLNGTHSLCIYTNAHTHTQETRQSEGHIDSASNQVSRHRQVYSLWSWFRVCFKNHWVDASV